jgi:hypothetical protein
MSYHSTPQGKDSRLWHIAARRASFKRHLATYVVINIFLWLIWFFTGAEIDGNRIPWPVWSTAGWGIGLAFHYIGAYVRNSQDSIEKEYEKLQNQQKP